MLKREFPVSQGVLSKCPFRIVTQAQPWKCCCPLWRTWALPSVQQVPYTKQSKECQFKCFVWRSDFLFSSHHKRPLNCLRGILHLEQCFWVRFEICALGSLGSNTARASCSTWRCLNSWWDRGHLWHSCALIMCANCRGTPSQRNASPT